MGLPVWTRRREVSLFGARCPPAAACCALLIACTPAEHGPAPADRAPPLRRHAARPADRPAPKRRRVAAGPRVVPPRRASRSAPETWTDQRVAWEALIRRVAPLAKRGALLPTPKLRHHFRRKGVWFRPDFDARTLAAAQRRLLAATGPAGTPAVNGPAGRAVFVDVEGPAGSAARRRGLAAAIAICGSAAVCGLECTFASPGGLGSQTAVIRRLVRLVTDHALVLQIGTGHGRSRIALPTLKNPNAAPVVSRSIGTAVPVVGDTGTAPMPLARLTPGLLLDLGPQDPAPPVTTRLGLQLCRLAAAVPDALHAAWFQSAKARESRAAALARWLGLTFVDRPAHPKRPPLEHRYIRRHYKNRVYTWRRRADGAYLMRPTLVVLHHTGSLSLRSALNTLTALQLGHRRGIQVPGSLGVGVPYLVARDGTIYRLFKDDRRFGRHAIGLNHSAIGIENVGTKRGGLTARQLRQNVALVRYIALRYPLRYLVGHREVYQMARTPYYLEAVPGYCSNKGDPSAQTLRLVRRQLKELDIAGPPTGQPVLKNCRDMFRYFKRQRRDARQSR
ncbi:MAG: peptidoglycan recognition family protein [bacterium]